MIVNEEAVKKILEEVKPAKLVAATKYVIAPAPLMIPSVISFTTIIRYQGATIRRNSIPAVIAAPLSAFRNSPIIRLLNPTYRTTNGTVATAESFRPVRNPSGILSALPAPIFWAV